MNTRFVRSKVILIVLLVFSITTIAYAANQVISNNTPENGYVLCANKKTRIVTFPNSINCPSGTVLLDMGAASSLKTINATSTFANIDLATSSSIYAGVLPLRASMFSGLNKWHSVSVKTISFTLGNSVLMDCKILKMESLSGNSQEGTVVESRFPLFAGLQTTNEFSGEFIYRGGDYVLGCKNNAKVSISAEAKVQLSGEKIYK